MQPLHRFRALNLIGLPLLLLLFVLFGSQTACKGGKKNTKADTTLTDTDDDGPTFSGMPVHDAKIKGDSIYLEVIYDGSFPRDDDFTLTWNGKIQQTIPPQVTLELFDKAMIGPTSMAIQSVLSYSLTDLKVPKPCTIYVGGMTVEYK